MENTVFLNQRLDLVERVHHGRMMFAAELTAGGRELSRLALEALALEGYRLGTLNQLQVGSLLGLSRTDSESFLGKHADLYDFDPSELNREAQALANLSSKNDLL